MLEGLRELEEQVGFTVAGFVGLFLDDTPARLRALRSALDAGDAVVSHREAHTIKGSCREVGALAAAGRLVDGLEVAVQEAGAQLQQIVAE